MHSLTKPPFKSWGVDSLTRNQWQTTLDINLTAPFLLSQGLVNELEAAKGSIVNISSIHAKLTKKNFVAYATSKAALSGMTRAMAVDLGPRVRVNAVERAAMDTDMLRNGFNYDDLKIKKLSSYHPVNIIGEPCDLAKVVISLNSLPFILGSIFSLSGGIDCKLNDPGM